MSPLTTTVWYELQYSTPYTQLRARAASAAARPPARIIACCLSRPLSNRGPVPEVSIRSVLSSTCSAQPSCAVHFTLVHAQMVCWPAGPVSAVEKHAGMVRQAGYPLVWYLSSALSAGWRLKSGDGSTAAPFWIPSLPE